MQEAIKKQFIAGASCPKCGAVDKVQRWVTAEAVFMFCVACNYKQELKDDPVPGNPDEAVITLK